MSALVLVACSSGAHDAQPPSTVSQDAIGKEGGASDDGEAADAASPFCVTAADRGWTSCIGGSILASSYNQSCNSDAACLLVASGEDAFCQPCSCGLAAINRGALAQFEADYAKTPAGSLLGGTSCAPCCGPTLAAYCQDGQCVAK
jgi:hypothetical protein